ncbi:ribonuclease P protein component [Lichenibacterium dinghuense]|uniref:ribonuclease P protein component n=1 Tax=Lichenibacterium dinghuense TaxID=2895977 RepID=UPI001F02FE31|nr:ribonuclease P protein component [Lichenibacterium sp. 6Y81]
MSGPGAGLPDGPERHGTAGGPVPPARLKVRADFLRASGGARVHARSLSLQVYRRKDDQAPDAGCRVGLTVTKKVGNAVERNRVKRRFREALRAPALATKPDHDYVIVARREALTTPFSDLVNELRRCLGDAASGRTKAGRPRGSAGPGPRRGRGGTSPDRPT